MGTGCDHSREEDGKMARRQVIERPRSWNWRRIGVGLGVLGGLGVAFLCGRHWSPPAAMALPPLLNPSKNASAERPATPQTPVANATGLPSSDGARRPVAYIYGTTMISREELGEYLIARQGQEKLPFLVNHRIIEQACKEKKIEVTQAEVDASLAADLHDLNLSRGQFEQRLLKQYRKTLYEWKEDVIWPKLALGKLARGRVHADPEDLQKAFEAYHGEKVQGRIILFPASERRALQTRVYGEIRNSEDEFSRYARTQASPSLAAEVGKIPPIGHNTTGNPQLEREAFSLHPGEVSGIIDTPDGSIVVFKCDRRIPADTTVTLKDVQAKLEKEIIDKKTQAELPKVFEELKAEAHPVIFLGHEETEEEMNQRSVELLKATENLPKEKKMSQAP
jgi:foldase protein PrsA